MDGSIIQVVIDMSLWAQLGLLTFIALAALGLWGLFYFTRAVVLILLRNWGFRLLRSQNRFTSDLGASLTFLEDHKANAVQRLLATAQTALTKALKYDPQSTYLNDLGEMVARSRRTQDTGKLFFKIAKYLVDHQQVSWIPRLLDAVPPQLRTDRKILQLRDTHVVPKQWAPNSVAIYCGHTVEPWLPGDERESGIGGSETAVIEISRRLVQKGWQVTVFNACEPPAGGVAVDGVLFQNHWKFNGRDTFDVLWVWRLPEMFDVPFQSRLSILDLHDVPQPEEFTPERVARMDKIFVKTNYHRSLLPDIADDKFEIVGNGIDLDRFKGDLVRQPYRFMYSSSLNRGLDIILEAIWPKIKAALPQAELHVYYGWKIFYAFEKNNPVRMAWLHKLKMLMQQDGVIHHGRVGQDRLAEDILKSSFWIYPTRFPEIHCITACEMQAGGCLPITSGYAALEETVKVGFTLKGDPQDPVYQSQFADFVIAIARQEHTAKRTAAQEAALQFSWDRVADDWHLALRPVD